MPNGTRYHRRKPTTRRRPTKPKTRRPKRISGPFRSYVSNDPFRPSMSVKLQYSENQVFSTNTGGLIGAEQIYRLNSIFDPNFTGVGHQPYGFDEMAALYRKYKVNAVLIELTYTDPSEDGMFLAAQVQPPGGTFTLTSAHSSQIKEQPMSITRPLNNSGKQITYLKQYFKMSTISGLTPLQFKADVDLFTAIASADPTAVPLLRISAGSDRGNATATVICKIKLTYFTTFYERKVKNQS